MWMCSGLRTMMIFLIDDEDTEADIEVEKLI